jgi:NADPH2 dehydrogenase
MRRLRRTRSSGFDGVEVQSANGYLIDQFFQDVSNQRTDAYGGSVERRSGLGLDVVDAVVNAIGPERTAIRLGPWSPFQGIPVQNATR